MWNVLKTRRKVKQHDGHQSIEWAFGVDHDVPYEDQDAICPCIHTHTTYMYTIDAPVPKPQLNDNVIDPSSAPPLVSGL